MITPSFAPDFDLCSLLKESIQKYVDEKHIHYIIVDQRDLSLFSPLRDAKTEILTVESIIPSWIFRLPLVKKWWFSLHSFPIRNWILQQLVKLSLGKVLSEEHFIFMDSDNALVRPFDLNLLIQEGRTRLFKIPREGNITSHYKWHRAAAKLLGIRAKDYFGARYIGNIITWRRDVLLQLYDRIASISETNWEKTIARQWHLSEYILYGIFVSEILNKESKHFFDEKSLCLEYWLEKKMSDSDIEEFVQKLKPWHVGVMISAKAKMPIETHRKIIRLLETRAQGF